MYEKNDVLAQVLKRAKEDLGENTKGLPDKPPERGSLDICVYKLAQAYLPFLARRTCIDAGIIPESGTPAKWSHRCQH